MARSLIVSFSLTRESFDLLERAARARGLNRSEAVRLAIVGFAQQPPKEQKGKVRRG